MNPPRLTKFEIEEARKLNRSKKRVIEKLGEYHDSKRCEELRDRQADSMLWDNVARIEEKIDEIIGWINKQ